MLYKFKLFSVKIYAKIALKLSVAMSNSRLPTNFQLNIFIFEKMEPSNFTAVIEAKC